jgi:excisionase family DNA binding protein
MWMSASIQVDPMPRTKISTRALLAGSKHQLERPKSPDPTFPPPLAYRIDDAVRASGLGRSTIYKLLTSGRLRSVRVAGRRLIPAEALLDLLRGE